ncbi:T9SS type A sorting domain-containing protein [Chryseobacterium shandongense]|uniref:T9SS type A sorting domain-containing protein n=1 Tax=Chryseobacterium shandongense TaxID=1493872 RepID=UPI000F4EBB2A|nr:T9SS type A sorting domain-containing protein [Chryseobacterium shandongense]AZA56361.1 T9SS C-terminal target domain-containing protein [Chryseobacterium shandongense]
MKKIITLITLIVAINFSSSQTKILFDATKAEMASNADWVIDADLHNLTVNSNGIVTTGGSQSNPQKIPTPSQNGITSSTSETYWNGALSAWAVDLVKLGYSVETLPYNGKITYGDFTNSQDLSLYKVFVVDEPNLKFTATEAAALVNFVKNGGGLFMISDHTISDRNNDGWDSPAIWNDILQNNTVQANPFGITFDLANFSQTTTNFAPLPGNKILHGIAGNPTQMMYSNGTSMTLNKTNNSTVQGLIFKTGSSTTGLTGAMLAIASYGTGKVCALGDSSVPDDGTGDSGDSLYNGYTGDANGNHKPLLINAVIWLAGDSNNLQTSDLTSSNLLEIYPNPTSDFIYLKDLKTDFLGYQYIVSNVLGENLEISNLSSNTIDLKKYPEGVYIISLNSKSGTKTFKVIKK